LPEQKQRSLDPIPEIELEVLTRILRTSFSIVSEPVDGKPYAVRFIGSPYNTFCEDCRHIQIFTHHRGQSVSPHNVKAVLAKFEIEEKEFMEALFPSRPQSPIPGSQAISKDAKPN
jgi:hypothetical protein